MWRFPRGGCRRVEFEFEIKNDEKKAPEVKKNIGKETKSLKHKKKIALTPHPKKVDLFTPIQ